MAYEDKIGYRMEVLEDGQIQVCKVTHILKDGVEISHLNHRHVLEPGQDTNDQDGRVKAVAATVWTKKVKDDFAAAKAEREKK